MVFIGTPNLRIQGHDNIQPESLFACTRPKPRAVPVCLSRKWLGMLGELVNSYNNKVHRTLGMTPSEATEEVNVDKVRKGLRPPKAGKPRYGLCDWVRIAN
jgi:hypothetical protein